MMMKPPDEYRWFAWVYEEALGRLFFDGVKPLLERLDREYPSDERTLLDLGCGTGLALKFFGDLGYTTTGLDASYSMLKVVVTFPTSSPSPSSSRSRSVCDDLA